MMLLSLLNVNAGIPVPPGQHGGESKVCVQMENSDNMQYVIPIQVGNPGQKMMAIPDTGSFELVVPSTECGSGCSGHPLFNATSSTSFLYRGSTQVIHYGQGDVTTEVDYDTVTMAGMQVNHQSQARRPTQVEPSACVASLLIPVVSAANMCTTNGSTKARTNERAAARDTPTRTLRSSPPPTQLETLQPSLCARCHLSRSSLSPTLQAGVLAGAGGSGG